MPEVVKQKATMERMPCALGHVMVTRMQVVNTSKRCAQV